MDNDKIEAVLRSITTALHCDSGMSKATEGKLQHADDLIRDLRTQNGNQETKIVDMEEALAGATDTLHTLAHVITEGPTWEGVAKSIGATDEEDDRIDE